MSGIYTRDLRKNRYSPPPGYDGNTFKDWKDVSGMSGASARFTAQRNGSTEEEYTPEEDILETSAEEYAEYQREQPSAQPSNEVLQDEVSVPASAKAHENISSLIENLRGKIGREELIILLVMFLIASDGMCAEVLILALVLLAA